MARVHSFVGQVGECVRDTIAYVWPSLAGKPGSTVLCETRAALSWRCFWAAVSANCSSNCQLVSCAAPDPRCSSKVIWVMPQRGLLLSSATMTACEEGAMATRVHGR